MQRGETASCRGRDKNTLASSSNTTTPATTNTIKTHTDRYINTNSGMQSFSRAVFNHLFFSERLQNLSDSQDLKDWMEKKMGVTNVLPQSKSRRREAVPFFFFFLMFVRGVCEDVCVLQQDLAPRMGLLEPLPLFLCPLFFSSSPSCTHWTVLSVCLCVLTWRECGQALLAEHRRAVKTPFFGGGDESNIRFYSVFIQPPSPSRALSF